MGADGFIASEERSASALSDTFWSRVEPLIPSGALARAPQSYQRRPGAGRKRKDARVVFEAIVHVLRTGCPWKALPRARYGSASAIHQRYIEWERAGLFAALWRAGLAECDEMQGIAWRWLPAQAQRGAPTVRAWHPAVARRRRKRRA